MNQFGHQLEFPNLKPKRSDDLRMGKANLDSSPAQLVVAVRLGDTLLEILSLQELKSERVPLPVLRLVYGNELFDILNDDIGIIGMDSVGRLSLQFIFSPNSLTNPKADATRLLGKIAEALIVRSCRHDTASNRRWAMHARRGKKEVSSPDKFVAVGVGLKSTQADRVLRTTYSSNDPQRDVVWVRKDNPEQELLSVGANRTSGLPAGLQVKVSRSGQDYVLRDLLHSRYKVPVVYFDLGDDFYLLKDKLHACSQRGELHINLERDFVHGRTVDPDIHERLSYFDPLVTALVRGEKPDSLIAEEMNVALLVSYLEKRGKTPLVLVP